MLFKLKCFVVVFWFAFGSFAQFSNYNVGDVVNNFTVTDNTGQSYTLYDLLNQGKYVYIDFFATNCGTCQTKMPIFNAFYDKYGCNAGDVFCLSIEVAGHNDTEVISFEQQYGGSTNHAPAISIDGGSANVINDFGVTSYPVICAIAPDKKLIVENIFPVQYVSDIAQSFPANFNPPVMNCTNSIEKANADIVKISPVPVRNKLHITTSKNKLTGIKIFNLNGQVVFKQKTLPTNNFVLDVFFKNGVYLLELSTERVVQYKKIIVIN